MGDRSCLTFPNGSIFLFMSEALGDFLIGKGAPKPLKRVQSASWQCGTWMKNRKRDLLKGFWDDQLLSFEQRAKSQSAYGFCWHQSRSWVGLRAECMRNFTGMVCKGETNCSCTRHRDTAVIGTTDNLLFERLAPLLPGRHNSF